MPLINCKVSLVLTWSKNYVISFAAGETKFRITDVPVVTLSTQDYLELLKQLQSGFKTTINWNKYQSELTVQPKNRYLD